MRRVERIREAFRRGPEAVFVDGDDTLWYDRRYFAQLRRGLLSLWDEPAALSRARVALADELQRGTVGEEGFAAAIRSCAVELGVDAEGCRVLEGHIGRFLGHPIEPLAGAEECLAYLSARHRCVLYTQGLAREQERKLSMSGLGAFFRSIRVVEMKNEAMLRFVSGELGVSPERLVVIGNSVKRDVEPAVATGSAAIWMNHEENEHGRDAPAPLAAIEVTGWAEVGDAISV